MHIPDGIIDGGTSSSSDYSSPRSWSLTISRTRSSCVIERSSNHGSIVADGPTAELLCDRDLMAANRLELPYGFDPSYLVVK